nr:probable methyltransferase PMT26 [Ipomoea batatas]
MALGRYSRLDDKKSSSSSYCSTATIVVFVALCLVGVWMMTSSSVVPVQNTDDVASQESMSELKTQMDESSNAASGEMMSTSSGDEPKSKPFDSSSSSESNNNKNNATDDENSSGDDEAKSKPFESSSSSSSSSFESNNSSDENSSGDDEAAKSKPKPFENATTSSGDEAKSKPSQSDEAKPNSFKDNLPVDENTVIPEEKNTSSTEDAKTTQEVIEEKPKEDEESYKGGVSDNVEIEEPPKGEDKDAAETGDKNEREQVSDVNKFNDAEKKPEEMKDKENGEIEEKVDDKKDQFQEGSAGETQDNSAPVQSPLPSDVPKVDEASGEKVVSLDEGSNSGEKGNFKIEDMRENKKGSPVQSPLPSDVYEGSGEKVSLDEAFGDKGNLKIEDMTENKKGSTVETQDNTSPVQSPLPSRSGEKDKAASDVTNGDKQGNLKIEGKGSGENKEPLSEVFPSVAQSELLNETNTQNGVFSTQAMQSKKEKLAEKSLKLDDNKGNGYSWKVCNVSAGCDYIPCLDNLEAIKKLRTTKHYEHRERHCPNDPPTCVVPLPKGYQRSIKWPTSREKIWYRNVPHTKLADFKGHQNWVKANGEYLTFPGGGTQFTHGALHYIDTIQKSVAEIAWGKRTHVVLDVGCGVASFGGYLFDRDVLTMSFAPKDEHEAQVQFALERGIPALSAVMGTKRLPFPGRVFDVVHCARCRVPWHIEGGKLALELNRMLRPGGYFVWSATPVYRKNQEDSRIWEAMTNLTKSMCWDLVSVTKDRLNKVGIAIYRKPSSNACYEQRPQDDPPLCHQSDDPDAAWKVNLQSCMHKVPTSPSQRGSKWPQVWPARLEKSPYWLLSSQTGVYGKPAPEDFAVDYQHWKRVVTKTYLNGLGIDWSTVRNVMDMRAIYGGFAAALKELNVWVMNVISIDAPDTLPVVYERGLFGMYHDWCESFSTYPRSYDLLHADHLFSKIKNKCGLAALVAEVDRILRPEGKLIVRDSLVVIAELQSMMRSMHYEIRMTYSRDKEGLLCVKKTMWRPKEVQTLTYAIQ